MYTTEPLSHFADEYLDFLYESLPTAASGDGVHTHDDRIEDAERDAWLIGPSINLDAGRTELHVFDAARIEDGPVVSWAADFALPAGFHGAWVG